MAVLTTRTLQRLKPVVLAAILAPLVILAVQWGQLLSAGTSTALGANPVQYSIRDLGLWSLRLLILGLAITPLARLTHTPALVGWRRMIGLTAFAYVVCHLLLFVMIDLEGSMSALLNEVIKRKYILFGMIAFVGLVPLALTSWNAMIRRLGARRWRQLHRLVYGAALLGGIHFLFMVKGNQLAPKVYLAVIAGLLVVRLWPLIQRRLAVAA